MRRRFAHLQLRVHFLKTRCECFNLLLLFCEPGLKARLLSGDRRSQFGNGRLLCLDFFVFFEKLVEQHRVDVLIADAVGFSFFVRQYQGRIHLCDFFSNQATLGRVGRVPLVVKGHWFKGKDRFTGPAHGVNILLEPRRGDPGTKLAVWVNQYWCIDRANSRTVDAREKDLRGSTTCGRRAVVDADGVAFIKGPVRAHAWADIDVIATCYYVKAGPKTTHDYVRRAAYIVIQCIVTDRYVEGAAIVMDEGVSSNGRVLRAAGVEQKRCRANRGIGITRVEDQRSSANTGVEAAGGDAKHRKRTKCCVPNARSESLKGVVPRSSGEVGVAPGGRRHDALRPL